MAQDVSHDSLDNVIWSSLTTGHAGFAIRHGRALRYPGDVAPFVALEDPFDPAGQADVAALLAPGERVAMFTMRDIAPDPAMAIEFARDMTQMVQAAPADPANDHDTAIVALESRDVPDMLALVARTQPGPFLPNTIRLGRYLGVREDGQLVAMTGERQHPAGFTEISAVCVDVAQRGRGLARRLIAAVCAGVVARGETPMLHAFADNARAIDVYRGLGFVERRVLRVTAMTRTA